jgi:hypothetical protein
MVKREAPTLALYQHSYYRLITPVRCVKALKAITFKSLLCDKFSPFSGQSLLHIYISPEIYIPHQHDTRNAGTRASRGVLCTRRLNSHSSMALRHKLGSMLAMMVEKYPFVISLLRGQVGREA